MNPTLLALAALTVNLIAPAPSALTPEPAPDFRALAFEAGLTAQAPTEADPDAAAPIDEAEARKKSALTWGAVGAGFALVVLATGIGGWDEASAERKTWYFAASTAFGLTVGAIWP